MKKWINLRIKFTGGIGEYSKRSWLDLFVIDKVYRHLNKKYKYDYIANRFHRRSADDADGHQVSFLYFIDEDMISKIKRSFKNNATMKLLKQEGYVDHISFIEGDRINIKDTSDPNWLSITQSAFVVYIMSVCDMIMVMLETLRDGYEITDKINYKDIDDIKKYYKYADSVLGYYLGRDGCHAYLHHLRAVFGYHPIPVRLTFKQRLKILFTFKKWIPFKF